MKLGDVLRKERETKGLTAEEISKRLGVPPDEYKAIEAGDSPLEKYGALVLQFAQAIDQPVSNLYDPCGLPFLEIGDYEVRYTLSG